MTIQTCCIYCKATGVPFNTEHVIPQAFGSYGADTMVLNEAVCKECNSKLGKEVDQILSRDSFEALMRMNYVERRNRPNERFVSRRIWQFLPDEEEFGLLRGARMQIDWKTYTHSLCDQIIIRDQSGQTHTFLADEFKNCDTLPPPTSQPGGVRVVGWNHSAICELIAMARNRGIAIPDCAPLQPPPAVLAPDAKLLIEGRIEVPTWRAIAKIAFNYLAHQEGSSYVRGELFDPIRDFIRGIRCEYALVRVSKNRMLRSETGDKKYFEGHLVAYQTIGRRLMGKVSLYNEITYDVILCSDTGLLYSLRSGHAFDPFNNSSGSLSNSPTLYI